MDRFAVVVVSYNTREDLRACLRSVAAARPGEVVVADNGSTDGSRAMVREQFPAVTLLCLDENPGYGGAANRAIAATSTPYVFLLNSDTLIAPDALAALGAYLDARPGVAIAGPRLRNPDGSLQPSCYPFPGSLRWAFDNDDVGRVLGRIPALREFSLRTWAHSRSRCVPWVKGAALAIRRSAFEDIGGFDTSFFMYHEETDLCYRLAEAGWEVHFAPVTDVAHTGGTSAAQWQREMDAALVESAVHFHRKHYDGAHLWLVTHVWDALTRTRRYTAHLGRGTAMADPMLTATMLLPMELMLPRGRARSVRVLGSAMPHWTKPSEEVGHADLVLVAPSEAECRAPGWLAHALGEAEAIAYKGGTAYVLVPPRWRGSVERRLRAVEGLRFEPFAHLPDAASPGFVVPVAEGPLRYALEHAMSLPPWARRTAARLAGLPLVRRLLARWWPSVGFAVTSSESEPFGWLARLAPSGRRPLHVVTRVSWRGREAPLVLHGFAGGAQVLVAKVACDSASAPLEREAENLRTLRGDAVSTGARLPALVASESLGGARVIAETPVSGTPATLLLASQPDRLPEILDRVAPWLLRWHEATRTDQALSSEHLARWLEEPLQHLRRDLPNAFVVRLAETAERLRGTTAPLVAAHHDLTMSNVLLEGASAIGIVDWEEAEPHALPLGDFVYAATDLALAAQGGTRLGAFHACFARDGRYAEIVHAHLNALVESLGLGPDLVRLCFDACWLRHARNEADRTRPRHRQPRPFLELLRWYARHGDQRYIPEER